MRAYEELFADPESAGEAIKRAAFLVWRGAMELPVHTGIAPLPDGTVRAVIEAVEAYVRGHETDAELEWMLSWYHAQSPHLLELYGATPALIGALEGCAPTAWSVAGITAERMTLRGQMGRYWSAQATGAP